MAGGLVTLLLFSAAMAIASFAAGMLPLAITLSQRQLRLISTLGMGVLVGTSLIVIIPEGIEALYSVQTAGSGHVHRRSTGFALEGVVKRGAVEGDVVPDWKSLQRRAPDEHDHEHEENGEKGHEHSSSAHAYVGIALVSGFILMFIIDRLPAHASRSKTYHIALDNLDDMGESSRQRDRNPQALHTSHKPVATTTGLVIHAAADGIALGASSTSSNLGLEAVIFLAIMVHKAPAAFGLSAVLLRGGLSKRQVRSHLAVFSLAAPAGALLTWCIISVLGGSGGSNMDFWTGVLLLFSGGTFLYVAVHAMQEVHNDNETGGEEKPLMNTGIAVLGMMIPFLTQLGHHAH